MAGKLIRNLIAVWRGWGGALSFMPSVDFSLAETISLVVGRQWVFVRRVEAVRIVCLCDLLWVPQATSA